MKIRENCVRFAYAAGAVVSTGVAYCTAKTISMGDKYYEKCVQNTVAYVNAHAHNYWMGYGGGPDTQGEIYASCGSKPGGPDPRLVIVFASVAVAMSLGLAATHRRAERT